jgi:hypothetical protein
MNVIAKFGGTSVASFASPAISMLCAKFVPLDQSARVDFLPFASQIRHEVLHVA